MKTFDLALPHPSVIRSWYSSREGEPGFTEEGLVAIKANADEAMINGKLLLCNLTVDEIAIRKHLQHDGILFRGYAYLGAEMDDDSQSVAGDALV